jgi:hypothetical protein
MKINGGISVGNVIVIITIIVSVAVAWGSMNSNMAQVKSELDEKASKEVVDVKFEYIQKELMEIKQMLDFAFKNAN